MGRMMETVRRTFQLAHVMQAGAGAGTRSPGRRSDDATTTRPALPRQGHHRAGDHPRHRGPRRLTPAGPPRRHRPVAAGLLRRQARARAQVGHRRLGPARRGQRHGRRRRADPLSAGLGRTGRSGASLSTTFVSRGAIDAPELRRHGRSLTAVRETRGLTRPSLVRNRSVAAIDVDVRDGTVSLDGRQLAIDPVREVPLSRRYLLR